MVRRTLSLVCAAVIALSLAMANPGTANAHPGCQASMNWPHLTSSALVVGSLYTSACASDWYFEVWLEVEDGGVWHQLDHGEHIGNGSSEVAALWIGCEFYRLQGWSWHRGQIYRSYGPHNAWVGCA